MPENPVGRVGFASFHPKPGGPSPQTLGSDGSVICLWGATILIFKQLGTFMNYVSITPDKIFKFICFKACSKFCFTS